MHNELKWCSICKKFVVPIEKLTWRNQNRALYTLLCPDCSTYHALGLFMRIIDDKKVKIN